VVVALAFQSGAGGLDVVRHFHETLAFFFEMGGELVLLLMKGGLLPLEASFLVEQNSLLRGDGGHLDAQRVLVDFGIRGERPFHRRVLPYRVLPWQ